jgi:hypothetical protein
MMSEILGRICPVYIVVEGGPGTVHEAEVASKVGAIVIPIARTGGCAADLYKTMTPLSSVDKTKWQSLNDIHLKPEEVGELVKHIVEIIIQTQKLAE